MIVIPSEKFNKNKNLFATALLFPFCCFQFIYSKWLIVESIAAIRIAIYGTFFKY